MQLVLTINHSLWGWKFSALLNDLAQYLEDDSLSVVVRFLKQKIDITFELSTVPDLSFRASTSNQCKRGMIKCNFWLQWMLYLRKTQ